MPTPEKFALHPLPKLYSTTEAPGWRDGARRLESNDLLGSLPRIAREEWPGAMRIGVFFDEIDQSWYLVNANARKP
jgi:hypothetical protein